MHLFHAVGVPVDHPGRDPAVAAVLEAVEGGAGPEQALDGAPLPVAGGELA